MHRTLHVCRTAGRLAEQFGHQRSLMVPRTSARGRVHDTRRRWHPSPGGRVERRPRLFSDVEMEKPWILPSW